MTPEAPITTHTFRTSDDRACAIVERKKADLGRAREIAPALVSSIETEIKACEQALDRARSAASEYERESVAAERAELIRAAAVAELTTSHDVEPEAASRIVHAAEVAKYTARAYKRRADAAHSAASSAYARASKDVAEQNAAVNFAERLAGAVVDYALERMSPETRPGVIAWLPLAFEREGRAAFERGCDNRRGNRSYPTPPPVEEYEAACRSVFAGVALLREQAARQAAELSAFAERG